MQFLRAFCLTVLFCLPVQAGIYSVKVDAAAVNIPSAFAATSDSKVISGVKNIRGIVIDNQITSAIVVNCTYSGAGAPSAGATGNIYVAASNAMAIDNVPLGTQCFIRTDTGSSLGAGLVNIMLLIGG